MVSAGYLLEALQTQGISDADRSTVLMLLADTLLTEGKPAEAIARYTEASQTGSVPVSRVLA
ncbi:hypothetical protein KIPB_015815, partial [Kipferlia bialata]|eukprot:g15815.t1